MTVKSDHPDWNSNQYHSFVVFKLSLTNDATVTAALGYGNTDSFGVTYPLVYFEAEDSVILSFYYWGSRAITLTKLFMSTGHQVWSKKVEVSSFNYYSRYLLYDSTTGMLYFTSGFADSHFFICKIRPIDGISTYCAKYIGDDTAEPFQLKLFGDYLLIHGSSKASQYKSDSQLTYGNFVLYLHKDLQTNLCSSINPSEDTSLVWTDETLFTRTITLTDIEVTTASILTTTTGSTSNPSMSLHPICELIKAPTTSLNYQVQADTNFTVTIDAFTSCMSLTYTATLVGSSSMPSWASFDSSTRTLSGLIPSTLSTAEFQFTAAAATGSLSSVSITVESYSCDVNNCLTCSSTDICTQ